MEKILKFFEFEASKMRYIYEMESVTSKLKLCNSPWYNHNEEIYITDSKDINQERFTYYCVENIIKNIIKYDKINDIIHDYLFTEKTKCIISEKYIVNLIRMRIKPKMFIITNKRYRFSDDQITCIISDLLTSGITVKLYTKFDLINSVYRNINLLYDICGIPSINIYDPIESENKEKCITHKGSTYLVRDVRIFYVVEERKPLTPQIKDYLRHYYEKLFWGRLFVSLVFYLISRYFI